MDFLRVVIGAIIAAFLVYIIVYALFAIFSTIGFWWSLLLLFVVFAIILATVPTTNVLGFMNVQRTAAY